MSLRDNMTALELVLNMLAELTATEISEEHQPETLKETEKVSEEVADFMFFEV